MGSAYNILLACVSKPGVTWDKRLAVAFEAAIMHCVDSEQLREPAVQLFMIRNSCIKRSPAPVQLPRLNLETLLKLARIVKNALTNETNPGVSREGALLALLMELLAHAPAIAEGQLDNVLFAQLARQHRHTQRTGEQLPGTRTVASNHPTLTSRAYLEFAKHYFALGDKQAMLAALSKAMAYVPDDEDVRDEVDLLRSGVHRVRQIPYRGR